MLRPIKTYIKSQAIGRIVGSNLGDKLRTTQPQHEPTKGKRVTGKMPGTAV